MNFVDSLKRWFFTNNSSAAGSAARIPLLDASGNAVGSDTYANLASVLGVGKCQYIRNTSLYKLTNGIEAYRGVTIKVDYTRNDSGNYKWGEEITVGKTSSVFVSTKGIYAGSNPEYTNVKLYKNSTDVFVKVQSTSSGGSLTINSPLLIEESSVDVSTLTEVDWGKDVYCNYTSLSSLASALGGVWGESYDSSAKAVTMNSGNEFIPLVLKRNHNTTTLGTGLKFQNKNGDTGTVWVDPSTSPSKLKFRNSANTDNEVTTQGYLNSYPDLSSLASALGGVNNMDFCWYKKITLTNNKATLLNLPGKQDAAGQNVQGTTCFALVAYHNGGSSWVDCLVSHAQNVKDSTICATRGTGVTYTWDSTHVYFNSTVNQDYHASILLFGGTIA